MRHGVPDRLPVAATLARRAAELAMAMRPMAGDPGIRLKGAQDWVTEADVAVERLLAAGLAEAFPQDGFVGEETGTARDGAFQWVVDPIDGTSNYARGGGRWCVSVGLLHEGEAVLGVIDAPVMREVFVGVAGAGGADACATLNGMPIRISRTTEAGRAMVECGWSPRVAVADYVALCGKVAGAGAMLRAGGSGALGICDVAAGRLDAYLERHINLWDIAAGLAVLHGAGGVANDFIGAGSGALGGPVRASTPGLATELARIAGW